MTLDSIMRRIFLSITTILLCLVCGACASRPAAQPKAAVTVTPEGCTIRRFAVPSAAMGRSIDALVVLPPAYEKDPAAHFPILYALHGRGAAFDCWSDMKPLCAALIKKPMIVAMFDADNASWYIDAPLPQTKYLRPGGDNGPVSPPTRSLFTTFFFDEFIPYLDNEFRVEQKQRMLTGFSMGGYGAFHYLLTRPEAFVSVSSLSGALRSMAQPNKALPPLLGEHPQENVRYRAVDLQLRFIDAVLRKVPLPPIFIHCGTEDSGLLESNRDFARFLTALNIPVRYLESAGEHAWPFWRDASTGVIEFHWHTLHP